MTKQTEIQQEHIGNDVPYINRETNSIQYFDGGESCTPLKETREEVEAIPTEKIMEFIKSKMDNLFGN